MLERVFKNSLTKKLFLSSLLLATILITMGASTICYGQASLSVQAKRISDNGDVFSIAFGSLSPDTKNKLAPHYVEVEVDGDYGVWELEIYTDNFTTQPDTATWGYQYGGLKGMSAGNRVPMVWQAYGTTTGVSDPPSDLSGWTYLKDKKDVDIPGTAPNESWNTAHNEGYTNIAYGGPGYLKVVEPGTTGVEDTDNKFVVYLGGLFGSAEAGEYSTIISFDLYHLAGEESPMISHERIERIGIIGNKIVFKARITDDESVQSATIHYKIGKSGKWQSRVMGLKGTATEKEATYVLPPQAVTGPCEIYYWLEARDEEGNTGYWKDESSPQVIKVSQSVTEMVWVNGGKVVLPDGNPDDGEVMVDIPEGALNNTTKITIEQITDLNRIPGYEELRDWKPIAIYDFTEEGIKFNKAVMMNLLYFDLDNDGKPEDWVGEEKDFNEKELACFWWDGFNWRLAGGKIDRERNIFTTMASHFSYFGLFQARPMGISEYRPKERIITPACADGKNDVAYFTALSGQTTTINIYDITGKKIRTIKGEPYEWNGTDDDGNIVESGVYIYQFKANVNGNRRLVSGTIAVAK